MRFAIGNKKIANRASLDNKTLQEFAAEVAPVLETTYETPREAFDAIPPGKGRTPIFQLEGNPTDKGVQISAVTIYALEKGALKSLNRISVAPDNPIWFERSAAGAPAPAEQAAANDDKADLEHSIVDGAALNGALENASEAAVQAPEAKEKSQEPAAAQQPQLSRVNNALSALKAKKQQAATFLKATVLKDNQTGFWRMVGFFGSLFAVGSAAMQYPLVSTAVSTFGLSPVLAPTAVAGGLVASVFLMMSALDHANKAWQTYKVAKAEQAYKTLKASTKAGYKERALQFSDKHDGVLSQLHDRMKQFPKAQFSGTASYEPAVDRIAVRSHLSGLYAHASRKSNPEQAKLFSDALGDLDKVISAADADKRKAFDEVRAQQSARLR